MDNQKYSQQILEQLSVFNFKKEESDDSNLSKVIRVTQRYMSSLLP